MSSLTTSRTAGSRAELPTELPPHAGRAAAGIAIVLVAQLMIVLDATVVNVALPRIDADLSFGPAALSWVLNAYTLAFGGLLLLGGRLGDVFGRLRAFQVGLAIFTVASALGGFAQTPGQLVATRALQGVGAALAAPSVLALLTTSAPDEAARNRAFALFGAVSSGGASIGLILGGLLTDVGSWRWTLFINVPLGLVVLLLVGRFVDETPRRSGRFDLVGAASATIGAVSLVWALIGAPEHGWGSARTIGGFVLGAALLLLLARTETRHPHPMVQPHLVRSRRRVGALAAMALIIGANLSMFFLVVQYIQLVLGFGPLATGIAFLPFSLGIFGMSRDHAVADRPGRTARDAAGRDVGARGGVRLAQRRRHGRHLPRHGVRPDADRRARDRAGVHADHGHGPRGRRARARRLGVRPAADHAAARQRRRRRGDRLGVRRRRGAGPVRPGLQPALLTSAGFAALALLVAATVLRTPRAEVEPLATEQEPELVAEAA